jgi:hypothetical protein
MKGHELKDRTFADAVRGPGFRMRILWHALIMAGLSFHRRVGRLHPMMLKDSQDHVTAWNRNKHDIQGQDKKPQSHE